MPRKRTKVVKGPVIVYLPDDVIRRIRKIADKDYMTLSAATRRLVMRGLEREEKED